MDEPYTVGDFSPENYDKKFRGQVIISLYLHVISCMCSYISFGVSLIFAMDR
jgi:hypothetical protein